MDIMKDVLKKMENDVLIIYVKKNNIILLIVKKCVLRNIKIIDVIYIMENVLVMRKGNGVKNLEIHMLIILLRLIKKKSFDYEYFS